VTGRQDGHVLADAVDAITSGAGNAFGALAVQAHVACAAMVDDLR
jgi:hypothetical protein